MWVRVGGRNGICSAQTIVSWIRHGSRFGSNVPAGLATSVLLFVGLEEEAVLARWCALILRPARNEGPASRSAVQRDGQAKAEMEREG